MFDARRGSHWNPNYRIVLLSASWMIVAGIPTCSVGCGPNDHRHIVHSRPFELRLRFHFLEGRQTRAVQLNFDQMIATRSFKWTEMKCSAYHTAVGVLTTTINANNQWNFAIALQDLSPVKTCSELSWTSISELQWWAATIRIHVFESELRCSFGDRTYCKLCLFLLLKYKHYYDEIYGWAWWHDGFFLLDFLKNTYKSIFLVQFSSLTIGQTHATASGNYASTQAQLGTVIF